MNCDLADVLIVSARGLVLVIAAVGSLLCVYLGWLLYRQSVAVQTKADVQAPGFKLRVASAGPGVFLVAFGIWLLVNLTNRTAVLEESSQQTQKGASFRFADPIPMFPPSQAGFVRVQSGQPECNCLLIKKRREFFGGFDMSADDVRDLADASMRAISAAGDNGVRDREERAALVGKLIWLRQVAEDSRR